MGAGATVRRSFALLAARLRRVPGLLSVAALAAVLWSLYGPGPLGYDASYALVWGGDMVHGRVPDFERPSSPTPHPLANAVAAALAPLGAAAPDALVALSFVCFAALGYAAFLLGRRLFSAPVGVLFALILLTRPSLAQEAAIALIDIPFLALVVGAAAVAVRRPRRAFAVLALLGAAGLLRPEGWLLALAYAALLWPGASAARRVRLVAGALAAPLLWAIVDLVVTGDPLFSLHWTRELAARLERPRGVDFALEAAPPYLGSVLGETVVWLGIGGCLVALHALYGRALLPAALTGLGLVAFLCLGVAELPLLTRYLLVPAVMLGLFAGVAIFGWLNLPRGHWLRPPWIVAGGVLALVLAASAPDDHRRIRGVLNVLEERRTVQHQLQDLARTVPARTAVLRCPPVYVPSPRAAPLFTQALGTDSTAVVLGRPPRGRRGLLLAANTPELAVRLGLDASSAAAGIQPPPPEFKAMARNRSWTLYGNC